MSYGSVTGESPALTFATAMDERDRYEAEARGYLSHAKVVFPDGRTYPVVFYDTVRLTQDLEHEVAEGGACVADPGMIVVPSVTLEHMESAVRQLSGIGFFDALTPEPTPTAVAADRPRLSYSAGIESAPGNPFGAAELVIEPDGSARLDHRRHGEHRAWTGTIDGAVLDRVLAALERGGFPDVPRHPVPAGATMRRLVVTPADGEPRGALVAWHAAKDLPGYDEAFAALDSLARQMSMDSYQAAPDVLEPAVSDLRSVDQA